jgi:hypothetical protein
MLNEDFPALPGSTNQGEIAFSSIIPWYLIPIWTIDSTKKGGSISSLKTDNVNGSSQIGSQLGGNLVGLGKLPDKLSTISRTTIELTIHG